LEKSHIIAGEVFEESSCDDNLSSDLSPAFWHDSLGQFCEEVMNFWLSHLLSNLEEDITIHVVPVDILDGIVKSPSWDFSLGGSKGIELLLISLTDMNEGLAIERINDGNGFFGVVSLTVKDVFDGVRIFAAEVVGINGGPAGES
jgi:hypothetical protein